MRTFTEDIVNGEQNIYVMHVNGQRDLGGRQSGRTCGLNEVIIEGIFELVTFEQQLK